MMEAYAQSQETITPNEVVADAAHNAAQVTSDSADLARQDMKCRDTCCGVS